MDANVNIIKYWNYFENALKWYDEAETRELREALEAKILTWPYVTSKKMMGCPCYLAKGKMFAGLVTRGIVITKLSQEEREILNKKHPVKPFKAGDRTIKSWAHLTIDPDEIEEIMPYVKISYEAALGLK